MEKLRRRLDYENSNLVPKSGQIMSTSINLSFLQHFPLNLCTKFTNTKSQLVLKVTKDIVRKQVLL